MDNNNNNNNNNNDKNDKNELNKIKVAIRVRPLNSRELGIDQKIPWSISKDTISLSQNPNINFTYDYVFGIDSNTIDVYNAIAKSIVNSSLNGINGTIFAYGQTSSGKTFSMRGTESIPGIIKLSIKDIFKSIEDSILEKDYLLKVSYLEIYNEEIKDLLNPTISNKKKLKIHEDIYKGVVVANLKEEIVISPDQIFALMNFGEERRHIGSTMMNDSSSRSHTIFRMQIQSTCKQNGTIQMSTLTLVDLAGSERVSSTGAEGVRLKEGTHINKSLMTLSKVISKLSEEKTQQHVPYRDSKLTRILQPSLGGNSKTAILCTITPATTHQEESISTLQFAKRAKRVKTNYKINQVADANTMLKKYESEILELQNQLVKSEEINSLLRNTISTQEISSNNFKLGMKRFNDAIIGGSLINENKKKKKRRNTLDPSYLLKDKIIKKKIRKSENQKIKKIKNSENNISSSSSNSSGEEDDDDKDDENNYSINQDDKADSHYEDDDDEDEDDDEESDTDNEDDEDNDEDNDDDDDDDDEFQDNFPLIEPLDDEQLKKIKDLDDSLGFQVKLKVKRRDLDLIYEELEENKKLIEEYESTLELLNNQLDEKEIEHKELLIIIDQWEQECTNRENQNQELLEIDQQSKQSIQQLNDKLLETKQQSKQSIDQLNLQLIDIESESSKNKKSFENVLGVFEKSYRLAERLEDKYFTKEIESKKQIETLANSYLQLETTYQQQLNINQQSQQKIQSLNNDIEQFKLVWVPLKDQVNGYFQENQMFKQYIIELEEKYNTLIDLQKEVEQNYLTNTLEQQRNDQYQIEINQLTTEYNNQIQQLESTNQKLQTQLYNLLANATQSTQTLEQQLQTSKQEIDTLTNEIEQLKNQYDIIRVDNDNLSKESLELKQILLSKTQQLEEQLSLAQQQKGNIEIIQQLESIIVDNQQSIDQLKIEFDQSQQDNQSIKQSYNQLESTLTLAQSENQRLLTENKQFITSLNEIKSLFNSIQQQKETIQLEFEFQEKENQFDSLLTNYNQLFSKYNDLATSNESNRLEFDQFKKDSNQSIQSLESLERSLKSENDNLLQQSSLLKSQLESIEKQKQDQLIPIQLELESKKCELSKLSSQFSEQTKQVTQLLISVDQYKISTNKLESQISDRNEEINNLKLKAIEINALKEENISLKDQLTKLKKAPKSQTDREKDMIKKELEKLREKFNAIDAKLKQAIQDKQTIQSEKQSLEREIKDLKRSHTSTETELDKLKKTHLAADVKSKDFIALNKSVEILTKSQEQLKSTIIELESDLSKKNIELEKKQEELVTLNQDKLEKEKKTNQLESDHSSATIKLENYENQITQLTSEIIDLKSKFQEFKSESESNIKQQEINLKESNDLNQQLTNDNLKLTKQLSDLKVEFDKSKQLWSTRSSESNDTIKELQESIISKDKERQLTSEQLVKLTDQINLKTWEYNDLNSQCQQLTKTLQNVKSSNEQQEQSIVSLESQTSAKIKSLELEISQIQENHRLEVLELNRCKNQLSEKQTLMEQDNIQLNERIIQLLHQKTKHENEILSMESNIIDLENQTKELKSKIETAQQDFEIEKNYHTGLNETNTTTIKTMNEELTRSNQTIQQLLFKISKLEQTSLQTQQQQELQQATISAQQQKQQQLADDQEKQQLYQKIKLIEKELESTKQKNLYITEQFTLKESEYLDTITDYVCKEKEFEKSKASLKTSATKIQALNDITKKLQEEKPQQQPVVKVSSSQVVNQNGQPIKSILKKPKLVIIPREQLQQPPQFKELTLSTLNSNDSNCEPESVSASSTLTSLQSISKYIGKRSEQTTLEHDLTSSTLNLPLQQQNKKVRLVITKNNKTSTDNLTTTSTSLKSKSSSNGENKENQNNNIIIKNN
nr:kinesin-related protein K4 [Dictyostelium discoideum]